MSGLSSVIQTVDGYDETNVGISDSRVLNTGATKAVVIHRAPGSRRQDITLGNPKTVQNLWQFLVDIYCLSAGDPQTVSNAIEVEINLIEAAISSYQNFNGTSGVLKAVADAPEDFMTSKIEGSNYFCQSLHVEVTELEQVSVLEGSGA